MSGAVILGIGIAMIAVAAVLLIVGVVYGKTAGKRIREELKREYE